MSGKRLVVFCRAETATTGGLSFIFTACATDYGTQAKATTPARTNTCVGCSTPIPFNRWSAHRTRNDCMIQDGIFIDSPRVSWTMTTRLPCFGSFCCAICLRSHSLLSIVTVAILLAMLSKRVFLLFPLGIPCNCFLSAGNSCVMWVSCP